MTNNGTVAVDGAADNTNALGKSKWNHTTAAQTRPIRNRAIFYHDRVFVGVVLEGRFHNVLVEKTTTPPSIPSVIPNRDPYLNHALLTNIVPLGVVLYYILIMYYLIVVRTVCFRWS